MYVKQDKRISIVILLCAIGMLIWWIVSIYVDSAGSISIVNISLKNIVDWANNNTDLLIILYIFVCSNVQAEAKDTGNFSTDIDNTYEKLKIFSEFVRIF